MNIAVELDEFPVAPNLAGPRRHVPGHAVAGEVGHARTIELDAVVVRVLTHLVGGERVEGAAVVPGLDDFRVAGRVAWHLGRLVGRRGHTRRAVAAAEVI